MILNRHFFCKYSIKLSPVISVLIPFFNKQPVFLWPDILQNPHDAIFFWPNTVEFDLIFYVLISCWLLILFVFDFKEHNVGSFKFKFLSFSKGVNVSVKLSKCDTIWLKSTFCVRSEESTVFISNNIPTINVDIIFFLVIL